ncbi:hypothetical protein Taro_009607 [Colocasia esculenta]|uniref:Uncharacterized protein n=1 Tax=Colocasia esculenta TaxID=4460 RepID=A0A843TWS6_COLES|nr:hypothetical protein [Colocasia esculenta]
MSTSLLSPTYSLSLHMAMHHFFMRISMRAVAAVSLSSFSIKWQPCGGASRSEHEPTARQRPAFSNDVLL